MLPSFKDMKVPEQIIAALKNMGITKPMPVQAQAIPALYAGVTLLPVRRRAPAKRLPFWCRLHSVLTLPKTMRRR